MSVDKSCEYCGKNNILFKNKLTLAKEIVIIRLTTFSLQDNKLIKISQKFNLFTISTTKLLIAEQQYKVMNAIFHHGSGSMFIIQVCAEKKDLGLKLMMRKLEKAIA